jgi:transposase-like protein
LGKHYFTKEQQQVLKSNKYIKSVSEKAITYTVEFKEKFLEEYNSGKFPRDIIRDIGINPDILGKSRIKNLTNRIKKNNDRLDGQIDTRKTNSGRPRTAHLTDEEKIKRLEQKLAYLNQENEFLKKNLLLDRRVAAEHKQRQQTNSKSSKK